MVDFLRTVPRIVNIWPQRVTNWRGLGSRRPVFEECFTFSSRPLPCILSHPFFRVDFLTTIYRRRTAMQIVLPRCCASQSFEGSLPQNTRPSKQVFAHCFHVKRRQEQRKQSKAKEIDHRSLGPDDLNQMPTEWFLQLEGGKNAEAFRLKVRISP